MGVGGRGVQLVEWFYARQIYLSKDRKKFPVENGTPQCSVISPLIFSVMIIEMQLYISSIIAYDMGPERGYLALEAVGTQVGIWIFS